MRWSRRPASPKYHGASQKAADSSSFTTVLPSSLPGLHFQARITLCWRLDEESELAGSTVPTDIRARTHLRRLAARITQRCTVVDCLQAMDEIRLSLSTPAPLPGSPMASGWIRDVDLQASPDDVARAVEHMAAQRHEHLRSFRVRRQAENLRALLSDPGLAHAWFLASGRDHLGGEAYETLKKACGAVAESGALPDISPSTHEPLAHTIALLLSRLTSSERQVLLDQLPNFLKFFNHEELADDGHDNASGHDHVTRWLDG